MSKILMFILGFIFAFSTFAYAQEKYTVSGEVKFPKRKGVICTQLLTQDEYENHKTPPPERNLTIRPNPQELNAKRVTFSFIGVPKGAYIIYCHQDLNENGTLDFAEGVWTKNPTEPQGFSGRQFWGSGLWDDIKLEVDKDIIEIDIEMR
jgi:uncharacterized protein (DUF2141 family)